jgi:hypothetical protein
MEVAKMPGLPAKLPHLPAARGQAPWPSHEHVKGWGAFGLPFDSGHVLALRVFPENCLGRGDDGRVCAIGQAVHDVCGDLVCGGPRNLQPLAAGRLTGQPGR